MASVNSWTVGLHSDRKNGCQRYRVHCFNDLHHSSNSHFESCELGSHAGLMTSCSTTASLYEIQSHEHRPPLYPTHFSCCRSSCTHSRLAVAALPSECPSAAAKVRSNPSSSVLALHHNWHPQFVQSLYPYPTGTDPSPPRSVGLPPLGNTNRLADVSRGTFSRSDHSIPSMNSI